MSTGGVSPSGIHGNGGGGNGGGNGGSSSSGSGGGGNGGGGSGNGNGGNGKKPKKKKKKDDADKKVRRQARRQARLATQGQMSQIQKDIGQTKRHDDVIDQAFDAFQGRLEGFRQSGLENTRSARESVLAARGQLEEAAGIQTGEMSADAQKRASLLGHSSGAQSAIEALGGGAARSRVSLGGAVDSAMANVGLAEDSDLARRGSTGERDRIRSHEDNEAARQGLREDRRSLKREKGDLMSQAIEDILATQAEQAIAARAMGISEEELALDQLNSKADRRSQRRQDKLDAQAQADKLAQEAIENDREERAAAGEGKSTLSPSEKKEFTQKKNKVESVIDVYKKARRDGFSVKQASNRARRSAGGERWMATIASQVVDHGGLNGKGKRLVKGNFPGGRIPTSWK